MKALRKYIITLLVESALVLLILMAKDFFAQTDPVTIFHILADAFFAVGIITSCFGLLIFSTNEGTFDMLKYGLDSFFGYFKKDHIKKYETFYDYRESRADKKLQFGFMVICGLLFLAVSFVMFFFYSKYA